jgi:hypothetical protein
MVRAGVRKQDALPLAGTGELDGNGIEGTQGSPIVSDSEFQRHVNSMTPLICGVNLVVIRGWKVREHGDDPARHYRPYLVQGRVGRERHVFARA